MSDQKLQNHGNTTKNVQVNKKRRIMLGAGAMAPVVLTLASPSVLGAGTLQCLSQQLSGNLSHPVVPGCEQGSGPGHWASNTDWSSTPYTHHDSDGSSCAAGPDQATGGSTFADAFPGDAETRAMAEILCSGTTSLEAHFIAAILNAYALSPNYVLTPTQVRELRNGAAYPLINGPSTTVSEFLASTWT